MFQYCVIYLLWLDNYWICSFQIEYVKELIERTGVVAVPGRGFFHTNLTTEKFSQVDSSYQEKYIRFAFCKSEDTLASAAKRLKGLSRD